MTCCCHRRCQSLKNAHASRKCPPQSEKRLRTTGMNYGWKNPSLQLTIAWQYCSSVCGGLAYQKDAWLDLEHQEQYPKMAAAG